jgi:hypothetical protein
MNEGGHATHTHKRLDEVVLSWVEPTPELAHI